MATRRMVTAADRAEISTGVKAGWTITKIAAHVGRDKSVISRELARNSTKTRGYRMVHADCRAQRSRARPQVGKIAGDPLLEARVRADLKQGRSPRAIAGRLRAEHDDRGLPAPTGSPSGHGYLVSHEAVYAYIYALPKGTWPGTGSGWSRNGPVDGHGNPWGSGSLDRSWGWCRSRTDLPTSPAGKSRAIGRVTS